MRFSKDFWCFDGVKISDDWNMSSPYYVNDSQSGPVCHRLPTILAFRENVSCLVNCKRPKIPASDLQALQMCTVSFELAQVIFTSCSNGIDWRENRRVAINPLILDAVLEKLRTCDCPKAKMDTITSRVS